jgi:diacylglycerol kinase family enzyme
LTSSQIFRYRKELASGCLDNVPGSTVMHAKKIDILGPKKLPLFIEGQVYTKAPATITVAKEKIKLIVGKSRQF